MLLQLGLMVQFALLILSVAIGPHLSESPLSAILLLVVGAAIAAPTLPVLVRTLVRLLALTPLTPPTAGSHSHAPAFTLPSDPGTPGTALARAPALGAHSLA